jgi:uncharacterized membrane protein
MAQTREVKEQEQRAERGGQPAARPGQQVRRGGEAQSRRAQGGRAAGRPNGSARAQGGLKGLSDEQLARGLGWFSIGLGLAEVIAPRGLARLIGVRGNHDGLFRALGAREIASGVGILTRRRPAGFLWSRVGGDAVDLGLLGAAFTTPKANRGRLAAATAAVAGVTALDVICSRQLSRHAGPLHVTQSVAINRPPEELYRFWRDFQNLPRFMAHLESVQVVGQVAGQESRQSGAGERSHWAAKAPAGTTVEWDAEITEDRPNELIAWRSLEGADVDNAGTVRFEREPGGRGTLVTVEMNYNPPAGAIGAGVAKLFGEDPEWQVKDSLRRFKQVMETGEVITTEGQPSGRSSSTSWRYDGAVRG